MRKPFSYIRRCLALGFMLSGMCTLTHAQGDQQGTQMHAQSDQQGTLYIEKRDGTTIKIPITPGYPSAEKQRRRSTHGDSKEQNAIRRAGIGGY